MDVKTQLWAFYDQNAKKYAATRSKHRADVDHILTVLDSINVWRKKLRILELGCGQARTYKYLQKKLGEKINYTGIDLSKKLLAIAKKKYPNAKFVCEDMTKFVAEPKQESFDIIIATASFQHLPTVKERMYVLKNCYRILKYDGKLVMLNWAFSNRFKKNYNQQILKAWLKFLYTFGKSSRRDVLVPRKSEEQTFYRYYHLFTLSELNDLVKRSGFVISKLCHLDNRWQEVDNQDLANNSLVVADKAVFDK